MATAEAVVMDVAIRYRIDAVYYYFTKKEDGRGAGGLLLLLLYHCCDYVMQLLDLEALNNYHDNITIV